MWLKVRSTTGLTWYGAKDNLEGTYLKEKPSQGADDKKRSYIYKFDNYNKFLFYINDKSKWIMTNKDQVLPASNNQKIKSSLINKSYLS
jgi:hypothetical protein